MGRKWLLAGIAFLAVVFAAPPASAQGVDIYASRNYVTTGDYVDFYVSVDDRGWEDYPVDVYIVEIDPLGRASYLDFNYWALLDGIYPSLVYWPMFGFPQSPLISMPITRDMYAGTYWWYFVLVPYAADPFVFDNWYFWDAAYFDVY